MYVLAFAALGLIVGSFLNVLVLRRRFVLLGGRSKCMSCGATIRWYDNVPVLSWILLRGRCRACGSAISMQYPVVELLTGAAFLAIGAAPGLPLLEQVLLCMISSLFIAIAVYDVRHTIIPDEWVYPLAALSLLLALLHALSGPVSLAWALIAGPLAALPLFALWFVSKGAWMGFGDVKLALSIGWILGPWYGLVAVLCAFIVGAVISVVVLLPLPYYLRTLRSCGITGLSPAAAHFTMRSEVPFGPFLIFGYSIIWLSLLFHIPLPL